MLDTFLARYAGQSLAELRGVERLTERDKRVARACIISHIEAEVRPLEQPTLGTEH